ncbi:MAG: TorF family putative porin [Rickettsiales bacterium]|nr:TorF family putative porin [Rickettsiales bacterium]
MKRAARLFLLLSSGIMLPSALMAQTAASGAESEPFFSGSFSGNVGLTTDYMFRGISQTDESPAIQGGFTYKQEMDPPLICMQGCGARMLITTIMMSHPLRLITLAA